MYLNDYFEYSVTLHRAVEILYCIVVNFIIPILVYCLTLLAQMCGIDVSRCKVMGSKKKPLLLILKDADTGGDIELIVKVIVHNWSEYAYVCGHDGI